MFPKGKRLIKDVTLDLEETVERTKRYLLYWVRFSHSEKMRAVCFTIDRIRESKSLDFQISADYLKKLYVKREAPQKVRMFLCEKYPQIMAKSTATFEEVQFYACLIYAIYDQSSGLSIHRDTFPIKEKILSTKL